MINSRASKSYRTYGLRSHFESQVFPQLGLGATGSPRPKIKERMKNIATK